MGSKNRKCTKNNKLDRNVLSGGAKRGRGTPSRKLKADASRHLERSQGEVSIFSNVLEDESSTLTKGSESRVSTFSKRPKSKVSTPSKRPKSKASTFSKRSKSRRSTSSKEPDRASTLSKGFKNKASILSKGLRNWTSKFFQRPIKDSSIISKRSRASANELPKVPKPSYGRKPVKKGAARKGDSVCKLSRRTSRHKLKKGKDDRNTPSKGTCACENQLTTKEFKSDRGNSPSSVKGQNRSQLVQKAYGVVPIRNRLAHDSKQHTAEVKIRPEQTEIAPVGLHRWPASILRNSSINSSKQLSRVHLSRMGPSPVTLRQMRPMTGLRQIQRSAQLPIAQVPMSPPDYQNFITGGGYEFQPNSVYPDVPINYFYEPEYAFESYPTSYPYIFSSDFQDSSKMCVSFQPLFTDPQLENQDQLAMRYNTASGALQELQPVGYPESSYVCPDPLNVNEMPLQPPNQNLLSSDEPESFMTNVAQRGNYRRQYLEAHSREATPSNYFEGHYDLFQAQDHRNFPSDHN